LECFGAFWKVYNEVIPPVPPEGQSEKGKALKLGVKAASVPKWAQRSQESVRELGAKFEDRAEKRVKCEMCTENDEKGRGWERQSP
jgi:hypothetical protein